MIKNKKVTVVIPAYNATKTLEKTVVAIPEGIADLVILTDDGSTDNTFQIARELGLKIFKHEKNLGYGAAMKTCFSQALKNNTDIIVVLHSDNQYEPRLVSSLASILAEESADVVLASRMLDKNTYKKMPFYRFAANRILSLIQNLIFGNHLTEYHTGYRAYKSCVLKQIPFERNSNNFVFDNELLVQILYKKFKVAEIPCTAIYNMETSSISIKKSFIYFFGVLKTSCRYLLHKLGFKKYQILSS